MSATVRTAFMLKTCEEGTRYLNHRCEGTPLLLSLEEAHAAARRANEERFAGYSNWRVPDYMQLLGFFHEVSAELRASTSRPTEVVEREMAQRLFTTPFDDRDMPWLLPRGGQWNDNGRNELGGGVVFLKSGRYRLRLVRYME